MILFIEGPRHSGKTYLINKFLETCKDPRVEYYKFYFADHIKTLGITGKDSTDALHYFSLGNIMTILEMNQREEYKDRIWIFDRAIISAYTWAKLRERMSDEVIYSECKILLNSDLFKNCKTLLVSPAEQTADSTRVKDIWDGAHTTAVELFQMFELLDDNLESLSDLDRGNEFEIVKNEFDQASVERFNLECYRLLGLEPNK